MMCSQVSTGRSLASKATQIRKNTGWGGVRRRNSASSGVGRGAPGRGPGRRRRPALWAAGALAAYTGLRAGELVALRGPAPEPASRPLRGWRAATEVDGRLVWADQDLRPTHGAAASVPLRPARRVSRRASARSGRSGVHRAAGWPAAGAEVRRRAVKAAARADSPTGCGSMTFAVPVRACSSPRAPASRRSRPSSAMPRQR
jgi:hypothetical protein